MAKIRNGSTYLGTHLTAGDYYSLGEQLQGVWVGQLAQEWNLRHPVRGDDQAFENLRKGLLPDGSEKLTQRKKDDAIAFYDFQLSTPKSVSVLAVTMGDDRLRHAHERAADRAFQELESFAARRVPKQEPEVTGKLVVAKFTHDASRQLDPQIHSHFTVANVTQDSQGKRWALETLHMCEAIRYCSKAYQNEMAREVMALGYQIETTRNEKGLPIAWEIVGVSEEIRTRFSKRRQEVEAAIAEFIQENGRPPSPAEIHVLTKQTRAPKLAEITTAEVRQKQVAQLTKTELTKLQELVRNAEARAPVAVQTGEESLAVQEAVAHLFERQSVAPKHAIAAEAFNERWGRLNIAALRKVVAGDLVELEPKKGFLGRVTTKDALELEKWACAWAAKQKNSVAPLLDEVVFPPPVSENRSLTNDQKQVIRDIVNSRDKAIIFRGVAGTGKTFTLSELNRIVTSSGWDTVFCAPTATARDELSKEGLTATTLQSLLIQKNPGLTSKTILIVDEAGLASQRQGTDVLKHAERTGARVLFVGDSRQHSGVEAGDFLRVLETYSPIARTELKDIRRQKGEEYRGAIYQMATGDTVEGFDVLDRQGAVETSGAHYVKKAASEYVQRIQQDGEDSVLAVSPTHAEGEILTSNIRAELRACGKLGPGQNRDTVQSLQWTTKQRAGLSNYQKGQAVTFTLQHKERGRIFERGSTWEVVGKEGRDVCLRSSRTGEERSFRPCLSSAKKLDVGHARKVDLASGDKIQVGANDKKCGLVNGQVLKVESISKDGTILTQDGKRIPPEFKAIRHGYVITSHKSQGKAADHVIICASKIDRKACYVAASRGYKSCRIHTPDKEHLRDGLKRSGDRVAAIEVRPKREPRINVAPRPFRRIAQKLKEKSLRVAQSLRERASSLLPRRLRTVKQDGPKLPAKTAPGKKAEPSKPQKNRFSFPRRAMRAFRANMIKRYSKLQPSKQNERKRKVH